MIPGVLKAFTGAHEVVTTIMLNYIAIQVVLAYLVTGPLREHGRVVRPVTRCRQRRGADHLRPGHTGHLGIILPFVAVPIIWWLLYRSTLGFEIRTVGANPDASRYAGMQPRRLMVLTMALGGLLGGLAGAVEILGRPATTCRRRIPRTSASTRSPSRCSRGPIRSGVVFAAACCSAAMRAGAPADADPGGRPGPDDRPAPGLILFFLAANVIVRRLFRDARRGRGGELKTVARTYAGQTSTAP